MRRADQKAATRALILSVASAQFTTHGYELVGMRDIAKAAKRTTGAIFGHFASKEDLWLEAMRRPVPSEARCAELEHMLRDLVGGLECSKNLPAGMSQIVKDARALVPRRG